VREVRGRVGKDGSLSLRALLELLRGQIRKGISERVEDSEVEMRPMVKLICPNGCPAHIDRSPDFEAKKIVGRCRGCGAEAIEPKEE